MKRKFLDMSAGYEVFNVDRNWNVDVLLYAATEEEAREKYKNMCEHEKGTIFVRYSEYINTKGWSR